MRTRFEGMHTLGQLVQDVGATCRTAYDNADASLVTIMQALGCSTDKSLFSVGPHDLLPLLSSLILKLTLSPVPAAFMQLEGVISADRMLQLSTEQFNDRGPAMACVDAVWLPHSGLSCVGDAFQNHLQEHHLTMHMQCLVSTYLNRVKGKLRGSCTAGGVQPATSRGPSCSLC